MRRQTLDGTWHDFDATAERLRFLLLKNGAPEREVNDYVVCDLQHVAAKREGRLYFDYDRQCWVNT